MEGISCDAVCVCVGLTVRCLCAIGWLMLCTDYLLDSSLVSRGGEGHGAHELIFGGGGAYEPRYGWLPGCE